MATTANTDTAALHVKLQELERREQEVSKLRRQLHDRIDSFPKPELLERERLVSAERRALHREIDALREQLGIAPE
jgi:vacuolar-type H+-ATPase subunit E/Vma4